MNSMARPAAVVISLFTSISYAISAQEDAPWRQAYRDLSRNLSPDDSQRQLQVGLWCLEKSVLPEAFDHLDLALRKKGAESALLRKALERGREPGWLHAAAKALSAAGSEEAQAKSWLVHASGKSPSRALLAEIALETAEPAVRAEACRLALFSPRIELRGYAVGKVSSWFPQEKAGALLLEKTLCDLDPTVRELAAEAFKPERSKEACSALLPFLSHAKPAARIHAAEALGHLGESAAIPSLIAAWKAATPAAASENDGGGPRAYAFFGKQQAYVRDFDIQIAQAAVIAKPVVGVLQSGSIIDVRILGVSQEISYSLERKILHHSLVKLAGRDLGADPDLWQSWWSQREGVSTPKSH